MVEIVRWRYAAAQCQNKLNVGRRGRPATWLPRQKLGEERILERGEVSWVFPNGPEQFLIKFEIFIFFDFSTT